MATTQGKLQSDVGIDRITGTGTDQDAQNAQNPHTGRHGRHPAPRCCVKTEEAGESEVKSEASAAAHGARGCPTPTVSGETQRSGWSSRRAAGPPNGCGGGARDNRLAEARGMHDNIGATATADTGQLETRESRCTFVDTGPKTITVRLQARHTLVGHVRDQVAAPAGIDTTHQRLMFAGKQLPGDDHTLEHYGVTEQCTLHLLGRVWGGMPEDTGDGLSSSKRPRLAFEDPMDIEAAGLDPLYAQWKVWLETCAPIATAFLPLETKAAKALGYRDRATRQALTEAGVQKMVHCAAPGEPDQEVLLALAAYDKAKPYNVDLLQGKWIEAPKPPQGQPQDRPLHVPKVDPMQKEIADLEAQLAIMQMLKIPFCSEEQLKVVSDNAMQAGMERDLEAGAEDAAKAGEMLRAAVWTTLYLTITTRAPQPTPQPAPLAAGTAMAHQQAIPVFQAAPQGATATCDSHPP